MLVLIFDEIHSSQITQLAISLLLQRLRSSESSLEAVIAYNLVDLGISAPLEVFVDIAKAYSYVCKEALAGDPSSDRQNAVSASVEGSAADARFPHILLVGI